MTPDQESFAKLYEQLTESQQQDLQRRVRVAVYLQKQTSHTCQPTHYCSEHQEYFCGECYTNHYRIKHSAANYAALEKFSTSPLVFWNKRELSAPTTAPKNSAQTKEKKQTEKVAKKYKQFVESLTQQELNEFYAQLLAKNSEN